MERVLAHSNKVVVSGKGTTAPIILPPDVFKPRTPGALASPPTPPQAQAAPESQGQAPPGQPAAPAAPGAGQ